jgi:hypothetical protein
VFPHVQDVSTKEIFLARHDGAGTHQLHLFRISDGTDSGLRTTTNLQLVKASAKPKTWAMIMAKGGGGRNDKFGSVVEITSVEEDGRVKVKTSNRKQVSEPISLDCLCACTVKSRS